MNQEELLITAIAIITVVFSCAIIWLQDKLDTARDHISPVLERRKQDESLIGTLRRTIDTTRKQLENEKQFSVKLISDHTKETAEVYRHAIKLRENNVVLLLERNNLQCELDSTNAQLKIENNAYMTLSDKHQELIKTLALRLEHITKAEEIIDDLNEENASLRMETKQATDIIDKTKHLLQRGARGQDTLAALVLIEEYQKNK